MSIGMLTLLMFGSLTLFILLGVPLSFALGGVAVISIIVISGVDALVGIVFSTFGVMWMITLVAIPLFVVMGVALERSGLAEDLYRTLYLWSGRLRGGLAMGTVVMCAIMGAMAGVSAAAVVTMGLIGLPAMLNRNYNKNLAIGSIIGAGPLGILIPPSVPMILIAMAASISIGKLFAGGLIPGAILTVLFVSYIAIRCFFQRDLAPSLPFEERGTWRDKFVSLRAIILPALIILAVLGSIFAGIASPTEAAAVGAFASLLSAVIYRRFNWKFVKEVSYRTATFTAMIYWITFGAMSFAAVYSGAGVTDFLLATLTAIEINRWFIFAGMILILVFFGMFLEPAAIILICAPIYFPIVQALGFDPIWFGVVFVMIIELGYLTPPFGYSMFYLKSVAPPEITMGDIYRSALPWLLITLLGTILVILFPQLALWFPSLMKG